MNDAAFIDLKPLDQLIRAIVASACARADMSDGWNHREGTLPDWRDVHSQIALLEVGPIMYRGLRYASAAGGSLAAPDIPEAAGSALLERALYRSYVDTVRINTALYDQLAQLVQEAARCRLKIVLLKGAYLAKYAYDDLGLRPMSDIDILVRDDDLDAAEHLMGRLGYRYVNGASAPGAWRNEHFHLNPFVHREHAHPVEVHFGLTRPDDKVRFDNEALWSRAVPLHVDGGQVLALDTLDLLLHLAVHSCYLDKLAGPGLRQTCDVATVVNRMPGDLDWVELARRAERCSATIYIYLSLELARLVCGARIPEEFTAHLRPPDFPAELLREAINRVFQREFPLRMSSSLAAIGAQGVSRANLRQLAKTFSGTALRNQFGAGPLPLLACRRILHLTRRYGKSVLRLCLRDMEARAAVNRFAGLDDRLA